jgi:hypothetical protein
MSEVNMTDGMKRDWRKLCLAVTNESDSTKLDSLLRQLIEALDEANEAGVSLRDHRTSKMRREVDSEIK